MGGWSPRAVSAPSVTKGEFLYLSEHTPPQKESHGRHAVHLCGRRQREEQRGGGGGFSQTREPGGSTQGAAAKTGEPALRHTLGDTEREGPRGAAARWGGGVPADGAAALARASSHGSETKFTEK